MNNAATARLPGLALPQFQCLGRHHRATALPRTWTTTPRTAPKNGPRSRIIQPFQQRAHYHPRRTRTTTAPGANASLDPIALHRLEHMHQAYWRRRMKFAFAGLTLTIFGTFIFTRVFPVPPEPQQNDAPEDDPMRKLDRSTPVITGVPGGASAAEQSAQVVPTGTSHVPVFPKTIHLSLNDGSSSPSPASAPLPAAAATASSNEYHLMGLGIRTVSFLRIQVYVVGVYVAVDDVAKLQQALIRSVDPNGIATTLIQPEKLKLRDALLDPVHSEEIWTRVLAETGVRSVIRVVPTRGTDFQHLRDGWVRNMTARTAHFGSLAASPGSDGPGSAAAAAPANWLHKASMAAFDDDAFANAMQSFKAIFSGGGKKNLAKGSPLLLARDSTGALHVFSDDDDEAAGSGVSDNSNNNNNKKKKALPVEMGSVSDPRVANLLWLVYLAGKTVASEGARESVVHGVMEYVERPIGTVATQVV
ncbi:hypothetical protein L228DRAFT_147055 [Xylona heveae TC161]|uniref:Chalcone isomerase domain-containing protein n=1 Tax=Xylona heveae (strain CBS 132557 / TC161) TaxID=1328760 RepID=A0A165GG14_XYLHT|nr:hypothetical protein L228DRAFT_147055 [Xylona heveae TC161]KZF22136.1 hypothetical protein L228DRAFT_147055 [Xylona heveae TC161]